MKTQMLKKPPLCYAGRDSRTLVAYYEEQEMGPIDSAIIWGVNAVNDYVGEAVDNLSAMGEAWWYVHGGQAVADAAGWLGDNVGVSGSRTPMGGGKVRVDFGLGYVEGSVDPPTYADGDTARVNASQSVLGVQFGVSAAVAISDSTTAP